MLGLQFAGRDAEPRRILCLGAHSDDIEIGCGGTVLKMLRTYPDCVVRWVVLGASGEREKEARESADSFLSAAREREVTIASFKDGFFPDQWAEIKSFFERQLKAFDPDLVLTHHREDRHQDHRIVSDLTWNTFRDHLILEYEIPKYDGDLGQPNVYMPLSASICQEKVSALTDHFVSQQDRHWFDEETFRAHLRLRGVEAATRYAEAFHGRKMCLQSSSA